MRFCLVIACLIITSCISGVAEARHTPDPLPPFLCPTNSSGAECWPSLAVLSAGDNICFGFLANDGFLYTAAHCLPPELHTVGTSCSGVLSIRLAGGDGFESLPIECQSVQMVTEVSNLPSGSAHSWVHMDLARLRIRGPSDQRPGFALSPSGLANGAEFKLPHLLWRQGTGPDNPSVLSYEVQRCEAVQRSLSLPSFTHDDSPLGLLGGCSITRGDSGAPVLGAGDAVHAIEFAAYDFEGWSQGRQLPGYSLPPGSQSYIDTEASPFPVAWVTNLACLHSGSCLRSPGEIRALERRALTAMASQLERMEPQARISLDSFRRLEYELRYSGR